MSDRRVQQSTASRGRLPRNWGLRAGLALVAATLGFVSIRYALANVIVKADPWRAHVLAPASGSISGAAAERLLTMELQVTADSQPAKLAREALRRDPTAAKAAAVLALQADLRGEGARSDRMFAFARNLSRRELRPQIWAIEQAVAKGDVEGALRHYDIALKTSFNAQDVLYPVLAAAVAEPRIRAAVVRILARKPPWSATFATFITMRGVNPEAAANLLYEGRKIPIPVVDSQRAVLLDTLLAQGKSDAAWKYYTSYRPAVRRNASRDPRFALGGDAAGPFDWRIADVTGISASILAGSAGGVVDFSVTQGGAGPIVSQVQLLPPGAYTLKAQFTQMSGPTSAALGWTVDCLGGRPLGRTPILPLAGGNGVSEGRFVVPVTGCPVQVLAFSVAPDQRHSDISGQIENAHLAPER